jgi:hypothetical protein
VDAFFAGLGEVSDEEIAQVLGGNVLRALAHIWPA